QRHQAVILVFSVLVVDRDVAALDKAHAAKALAKRSLHLRGGRTRAAAQIPDHRHWLPLRARRERPRRRAAEQRDELAPLHSITSSARSRIAVGSSMPMALAVFRFTTISNFVGCSMGKSEGVAPRAIRSTNSATRAKSAVMLGP